MPTLLKYKYPLGIIVGACLIYLAYMLLFSGPPSDNPLEAITPTGESEGLGLTVDRQLLALLLNVENIKMDGAIFSDPVFKSLEDFSTVIAKDPPFTGRENPFAPLPKTALPKSN